MFRSHKFLLQPTARQRRWLEALLAAQREIYNAALEERRAAWKMARHSVSRFDQFAQLAEVSRTRPEVMVFRTVAAPGHPDPPRPRLSRLLPTMPARRQGGLPPVQGSRPLRHRLLRGRRLGVEAQRERPAPLSPRRRPCQGPPASEGAGDPEELPCASGRATVVGRRPMFRCARHPVAGHRTGSRCRRRCRQLGGLLRRGTVRQPPPHHQLSRRLVDTYDTLVFEDLAITNMVRSARGSIAAPGHHVAAKAGLNREIHSAGWGQLLAMVACQHGRSWTRPDPGSRPQHQPPLPRLRACRG